MYRDMQRVYLVTLAKDTANPLAPKSDEVGKAAEKREKKRKRSKPMRKNRRQVLPRKNLKTNRKNRSW